MQSPSKQDGSSRFYDAASKMVELTRYSDQQGYRVVCFCDLESKTEYRLATNLEEMTNEEVSDTYRKRWLSCGALEVFEDAP